MSEVSAAGGIGEDAGRQAPYGRLSARMALQLAAPHTWPAAILPALVAVAAAAAATGGVSVTMACALLTICVLMQSAVNTFNDYYDYVKGADSADDNVDPTDAVLVYNNVNPRAALALAVGFLAAAFLVGAYVIWIAGWIPLAIGAVGAVVVVLYSAGRTPLSYLPVGELVSGFVMGGLIPLACYQALTGTFDLRALLWAVPTVLGVGLIMWACLQKSKYDLSELTYIGHRRELGADLPSTAVVKSPEQVRAERIMGVACGVIMLLALIVFLVWGFVPLFNQIGGWDGIDKFALKEAIRSGQGGFAVSWIAFAVGGILCGIVCLVGSVAFKSPDDWIAEAKQEDAWLKYAQSDAKEDPWARGPEQQESSPDRPAWK